MNFGMATRGGANVELNLGNSTDFVMHISRIQICKDSKCVIIDFTERKLLKYAKTTKDKQQQLVIMALVVDYKAGHVAVAWKNGNPVPLRVTKD